MSAAVSNSPSATTQAARLLLGMTPPPSDRHSGAGRIRTLLDLLTTEKFDGLDHRSMRSNGGGGGRWRSFRERLGFKHAYVISCCGASTWRFGSPPLVEDQDSIDDVVLVEFQQGSQDGVVLVGEEARGMNLAAALAAERESRPPRTPLRRLLTAEKSELELEREKQKEKEKEKENEKEKEGELESSVCCVCMGRKKGAAMIPCGHTYCRVCSREVWVNRGACPLCNRTILDVLDIF